MPRFVRPSPELHQEWLKAHDEWGVGLHEDGFGLLSTDEVRSRQGFTAFVARLTIEDAHPQAGREQCSYRWIVDRGDVGGGVALRHGTTECVNVLGHIGYGITPSARGRGLSKWALGQVLCLAVSVGLERVLLVCFADNLASIRTIEHGGGIFERCVETGDGIVNRYWVEL